MNLNFSEVTEFLMLYFVFIKSRRSVI